MNDQQYVTDDGVGTRIAACACGALTVAVVGQPLDVNACCCLECQKLSGSVLTYRARFPRTAIASIEGEYRTWRRESGSGRWVEHSFCPSCGTTLLTRGEGGETVGVSVGCFADPSFKAPARVYWTARKHEWYSLSKAITMIEEQ